MTVIQDRIAIYGEHHLHYGKESMCETLQSRLEAIQKLKSPTNQKGCQSFAGVANFVSIFCPELQKLLKPIYELTKKDRPFIWEMKSKQHLKKLRRGYLAYWS